MTLEEIKKIIKEKKIDQRKLCVKIGISASHLRGILNGWSPLKIHYEKAIEKELFEENVLSEVK